MKLNPIEERIIVEVEAEVQSRLIIIPDSLKAVSLVGKVIEIGPDCTLLQVGDKILYARYSGFKLPFRNEYSGCKLMNESDVLAIIIEED